MQKYKSYLRILLGALLFGFLFDILVPRLSFIEGLLCLFAVVGLFEIAKAELRAVIRDDARLQHEATRVWLRDWFDHDLSHTVTSVPFDPNHPHPWVAFDQRYGKKKPGEAAKE